MFGKLEGLLQKKNDIVDIVWKTKDIDETQSDDAT